MSEQLETILTNDDRVRCALSIAQVEGGLPARLDEAAAVLQVSVIDLVAMLNDQAFIKLVRGFTQAKASLALHGKGIERLTEIAASKNDKTALLAIQALGKLTGDFKPARSVDVKVTFEDLRKRSGGHRDPLSGMFDIKNVVDAEVEAEVNEGAGDE